MTTKDIILDLEDCITFNRQPNKELLENAVELMKKQEAKNEKLTRDLRRTTIYYNSARNEAHSKMLDIKELKS